MAAKLLFLTEICKNIIHIATLCRRMALKMQIVDLYLVIRKWLIYSVI